jgi:S-adenosylmethionine:tRNA ribosyltransferase-isomerase
LASLPDTLAAWHFKLPHELIAQRPLLRRSDSRMLRLDAAGAVPPWRDLQVTDLPAELAPGDLLVFNDTQVVPARLAAHKATGGAVEVLLERPLAAGRALVQLRGSRSLKPGQMLATVGGDLHILARLGELWEIACPAPALEFFGRYGAVPLPPYIERTPDAADLERYQGVLARAPGAVAAPTASLHFDAELLAALAAHGIGRAMLTLHVGAGTFAPVRSGNLDEHRMHPEWFVLPEATVAAVRATRAAGGRVIAVGTTVCRALESAATDGELRAGSAETTLFIRPGYSFRVIDGLLTNFHLPQSTLLMLVAALAGRERLFAAYRHAVAARYRFFSYGDCMLITRAGSG